MDEYENEGPETVVPQDERAQAILNGFRMYVTAPVPKRMPCCSPQCAPLPLQ